MVNVSVIIPAYKRIDQTLKTIRLLEDSQGRNSVFTLEIIVADSTPDSSLREALKKTFEDRVRYLKPQHPGIAANKNVGAKEANGNILIFVDSDIEVEAVSLEETIEALRRNPAAGAVCGRVYWRGGVLDGNLDRPRTEDRQGVIAETIYVEAIYSRYMATYKEVFLKVGGYDDVAFNMRGEGSDLSIRYWRAGFPLIFCEAIKVHHVSDVPDSAALRIAHPEFGIAKDFLLLAMKYDMLEGSYENFAKTIEANFSPLGSVSYLSFLQGIAGNMQFVCKVFSDKDCYEKEKNEALFNFKFLEVFSEKEMFHRCVKQAVDTLRSIREKTFVPLD